MKRRGFIAGDAKAAGEMAKKAKDRVVIMSAHPDDQSATAHLGETCSGEVSVRWGFSPKNQRGENRKMPTDELLAQSRRVSLLGKKLLACGCCLAATGLAMANVVYVSLAYGNDETGAGTQTSPVKTIQAGVNKLAAWNSVLYISNGVYKLDEPIAFLDKGGHNGVYIRSLSGNPADVVIDGQNKTKCITSSGYSTQFQNLTIANGYSTAGSAGLYLPRGGNVISGCIVSNCHVVATATGAECRGGGLYGSANVTVRDTKFYDCGVEGTNAACGGAIFLGYTYNESGAGTHYLKNVIISNCYVRSEKGAKGGGAYLLRANIDGLVVADCCASNMVAETKDACGGGLYVLNGAERTFKDVLITNCVANSSGAGLYSAGYSAGNLHLTNCTVSCNRIEARPSTRSCSGGGAFLSAGAYDLQNCLFRNNAIETAKDETGHGAGISLSPGTGLAGTVANCVFDGNRTAKGYGGGMYLSNAPVLVSNCVISANSAYMRGAFHICKQGSALTDVFCVSNTASFESIGRVALSGAGDPVLIRNSYFTGNGGETRPYFGLFGAESRSANTPINVEYCTFVSNGKNSSASYDICPESDNPNAETTTVSVSNLFVKGCVFSCGKNAFPNCMNTVTNITCTYADAFRKSWWTTERRLRNYNKAMMPDQALPFVNPAGGDYRLKQGTPFIDGGDREAWMGTGTRRTGPHDMGNGTYAIGPSGTYGVSVTRNRPIARIRGASVDYGCFEYNPRQGVVILLK